MLTNFAIEPVLFSFFTSLLIVIAFTRPLIKVCHLKNLVDMPGDERKLHKVSVPSLGGIIIFAATLFAFFLWMPSSIVTTKALVIDLHKIKYVVSGLLILFFVGVKDDIIGTSAVKKLMAHMIVAFMLVLLADIRITSMKGIFGIGMLPYSASVFMSVFTYIVIVNAFNLIDGIDGLAAGIGAIASAAFGTWFFLGGELIMACLAFTLVGSLIGFLVFNFSPAKIFMGDSGSLTIGLIISVLAIQLIEFEAAKLPAYMLHITKPVFVLSCLAYPMVDTLRVFLLRAIKGRSPLDADRNHIHHRLIDVGLGHAKSSVFVYVYSILVIYLSLVINMGPSINLISMAIVAVILLQVPYLLKKKRTTLDKKGKISISDPSQIIETSKEILSN